MFESNELVHLSRGVGGYIFAFVLGALWGSFANVCIYRWPPTDEHPKGRSVVHPPSHCPACKTPIRWYDNVPMIAYVWLRGRCRTCGAGFSARYVFVEFLTAVLFVAAWWAMGSNSIRGEVELSQALLGFAIAAGFSFVMVVITFIDLDHWLILDRITLPSIAVFYVAGLVQGRPWLDGLIGAAVGFGLVWIISEGFYRLTGREGLGLGDGKLLAVVGALLGWPGVMFALFAGSVLGSVIGIVALARGYRGDTQAAGEGEAADDAEPNLGKTAMPFGPFLAAAALVYLFAEPWILVRLGLP